MTTERPSRLPISTVALILATLSAAPISAQVLSPLSNRTPSGGLQLKTPVPPERGGLRVPGTATMTVKQIEAKPAEFPQITANQYKVAFECRITATPPQMDYSKFPRHSCFLDQKQTAAMNGLPIHRVDYFPSVDGVVTRIVMVADKNAANPKPGRIRTAFQLMHEKNAAMNVPVLKDFIYADGLLAK